jgi:hypothetical protein
MEILANPTPKYMKQGIWFANGLLILCAAIQGIAQPPAAKKGASPVPPPAKAQTPKPNPPDTAAKPPGPSGKYFIEAISLPPQSAAHGACTDYLPEGDNRALSAADVAQLIGDPIPFSVVARGSRDLLVYSTRALSKDAKDLDSDRDLLKNLEDNITKLANMRKFEIELTVPHDRSLGDVGSKVTGLNYGGFAVESIGPDKIRVSSDSAPDCDVWKQFLTDVRDIAWRPYPVSPVDRVFYSDGSEVATVLNGGGGSQGSGHGSQTSGPNITVNAVGTSTPDTTGGGGQKANAAPGNSGTSAGQNGGTGSKSAATGTGAGNGAATKPAGTAGGDSGSQSGSGTSPAQASVASGSGQASQKQSSPDAAVAATPDMLIFSEPTPGDDAAVDEKRRIVAMLDLPRPEMIVNVWSVQASTSDPKRSANAGEIVRDDVSEFNGRLQLAVLKSWEVVKQHAANPADFYDEAFYKYVAHRYVANAREANLPKTNQSASQDFLAYRNGVTLDDKTRADWGVCAANQYCLGYTELFHPLKPRLTDLLLAVIAAANDKALAVANDALDSMEGVTAGTRPARQATCEQTDLLAYDKTPGPFFECFREAAGAYLSPPPAGSNTSEPIFLLRSAVANFLFNYKIATEFPHEFSSYDLGQSAQALNTALSPMVDAFSRDIRTFQTFLSQTLSRDNRLVCAAQGKRSGDDPKCFQNSGMVTVRTVSGNETIVDTTTQSYLDVTTAPTLQQLMSSISQASGSVPAVLGNNLGAGAAAAMAGALNSMQNTSAKIGRGLKVDLMPRSLPGASAAEISVVLNVDETGDPALYTAGQASNANDDLSRVAKHDTQTKMRIDSLKIFEVSSLSAELLRARTRFPLLPLPGLEIPYIGSLIGIPRRPAAEYHSSIAILSAMVVPTAADLAYGTRFVSDRIVQNETGGARCSADPESHKKCILRAPASIKDFGDDIREFNRAMVGCLATGMTGAAPLWVTPRSTAACTNVTFDDIPLAAR